MSQEKPRTPLQKKASANKLYVMSISPNRIVWKILAEILQCSAENDNKHKLKTKIQQIVTAPPPQKAQTKSAENQIASNIVGENNN